MSPSLFDILVLSITNAALMSLGYMEGEDKESGALDFEGAQHNIDILCMLQEKCRGNLSNDEKSLLDSVLYDLRLKYVEANKKV